MKMSESGGQTGLVLITRYVNEHVPAFAEQAEL